MKKLFGSIVRPPCTVNIEIEPSEKSTVKSFVMKNEKDRFGNEGIAQTLQIFDRGDPIQGKVKLAVEKPFDHLGITIELIGEMGMYSLD